LLHKIVGIAWPIDSTIYSATLLISITHIDTEWGGDYNQNVDIISNQAFNQMSIESMGRQSGKMSALEAVARR
jgi:hypothetical protein